MDLIRFLLQFSWKMVAIAITTGFLSGSSSAGLIALISHAVGEPSAASLPQMLAGFAGLACIALLTSIVSQVMLVRLSHHAVFQLRMRLTHQILAADLSHLEQLGHDRLMATFTEDVQAVTSAVYTLPLLCIDSAIISGCLIYITWLSWLAIVLVLGLFAIAIASCQRFMRRGEWWLARAREEEDQLFSHFRATTEGIKELKLHYHRRQAFLAEEVEPTAINFRRYNISGLTLLAASSSWGKLLFFFAIGFVLFVLPKLIAIRSAAIAGYILAFTYLMMPMENIMNSVPFIIQSNIALNKIAALGLSLCDRLELATVPPPIHPAWQNLELKDVIYPYQHHQDDSSFTLGPIQLSIQPGEIVFITGGNGSGKSTLAKLITGLYIPKSGEIWFDGKAIHAQNREWYRQHFSAVFSDFYLFGRLLGLDSIDLDHHAQSYLSKLQLDHKVSVAQGKLSTRALSQGQRKRLALLAAYLEDRPIYLFDEWAADQDPLFKELFYTQFLADLKGQGKTIVVISHDDRYFQYADRLIKLDNGQIEFDQRS